MTKLVALVLAAATFASLPACGGGGTSCSDVVDHVAKLTGMNIPDDAKQGAIAKCEKEPAAKRDCVMKADSMEAMMACK